MGPTLGSSSRLVERLTPRLNHNLLPYQFALLVGLAVIGVAVVAGSLLARYHWEQLLSHVENRAQVVAAQMAITRGYITKHYMPLAAPETPKNSSRLARAGPQVPLPFTATREIAEEMAQQGWYSAKLVSFTPLNRANLPRDAFDREALEAIQAGAAAFSRVESVGGIEQFRQMTPDRAVGTGCIHCHTGYSIGAVLGGLSVSIPLTSTMMASREFRSQLTATLAALTVLLLGSIYLLYYRDIARRRRAEVELASVAAQLRQSQKMEAIGQLAGGIAHDFNNLLMVIVGYSKLLLARWPKDHEARESVEEVKQAAERATALTRQLLAFSRRQVLQPQVLDLNSVINNIQVMLRRLIGENIQLTTVLDPALGHVNADPNQLEQVIINLALNARDAMPAGGSLQIETANPEWTAPFQTRHGEMPPGRYVMLAMTDTGCGMSPEVQSRLFEPFFSTKEPDKGTGLGLSTVYGIIKQSNGFVYVYSEPGKGSTFKVYLPRTNEAVRVNTAAIEVLPSRGAEVILLVEDDRQVRALVRQTLTDYGYTVLEAANGRDALAAARSAGQAIDLLLTDVVMPDMNGRVLAELLKHAHPHPHLKVLYMSGFTDDAVLRHGVLQTGAAFLQKPVAPDVLVRKVRQTLDTRRKPSILIIDDEPQIRSMLGEALIAEGYSVLTASDGQEGLELCRRESIKLVITDILMPKQEGFETIQRLTQDFPTTKIIAMSGGWKDMDVLAVARKLGAVQVFQKPVDVQQLLSVVRDVVGELPIARS